MHSPKKYNKICLLIILNIFFTLLLPLKINAATEDLEIYAPSCILMEAETGKILYERNAYNQMFPASTTKVMTAILTLENCNLSDVATVSYSAIHNVPYTYSTSALQEGEELTINDLLHVLLIPSANDAAFVLAEHIAGSVDAFSDMMNQKAVEIGCKSTHFVNPNGIHDDNHYSTAYDLALMGQYAMKNSTFRKIVATTSYSLPTTNKYDKTDRVFRTTNDLLKSSTSTYYQYATGAKTGYTEAAQNCIIATATKNDIDLIVVILHDEKTEEGLNTRALDCKTLFEYGFNNYSNRAILSSGDIATNIVVIGASKDTKNLDLKVAEDIKMFLPNDYDLDSIQPEINLNSSITAPIAENTILGTVTYTIGGTSITSNLLAANDVLLEENIVIIIKIVAIMIALFLIVLLLRIIKKLDNPSDKSKKQSRR